MKHTKIFLTVLASLLTVCFCVFPFSCDVKAATTPTTTTTYGSYYTESYWQNSDDTLFNGFTINAAFISVDINNTTTSVFHLHYDFSSSGTDDGYTGSISITVTSSVAYKLQDAGIYIEGGWFSYIPSKTTSSATKTFTVSLNHASTMDFYIVHGKFSNVLSSVFNNNASVSFTYAKVTEMSEYDLIEHIDTVQGNIYDYMTEDMETNFQNLVSTIESKADYQIDVQSLPAWIFATSNYNTVSYNDTMKYPMLSTSAGLTSKYMYFTPGLNYYFYFMAGPTFSGTPVSLKLNNANMNLYSLPYYRFNGGYRIWRITITCPGDTEVQDALLYNVAFDMIPLYFGDGSNMTQEMQSILGVQSENLTTQRLQEIIDILNNMGINIDLNDDNVTAFNNGTDNVNDFVDTVTDFIPSTDSLTSDINSLPDFANDFVDVSNFVQSVYVEITNVLPQFKYFVIVGLLLFVFGVIIK